MTSFRGQDGPGLGAMRRHPRMRAMVPKVSQGAMSERSRQSPSQNRRRDRRGSPDHLAPVSRGAKAGSPAGPGPAQPYKFGQEGAPLLKSQPARSDPIKVPPPAAWSV